MNGHVRDVASGHLAHAVRQATLGRARPPSGGKRPGRGRRLLNHPDLGVGQPCNGLAEPAFGTTRLVKGGSPAHAHPDWGETALARPRPTAQNPAMDSRPGSRSEAVT